MVKNSDNIEHLHQMVDRVRADSFFLGSLLTRYQLIHGITDQYLADYLGCTYDDLMKLFLCRMPFEETKQLQKDIKKIAAYVNCNEDKLINIYREVKAIDAMSDKNAGVKGGFLIAARDRKKEKRENLSDSPKIGSKPKGKK